MHSTAAYSQHRRPGPPPTKKAKGNPVITRYPPPGGYQQPHQHPSWTPHPPTAYASYYQNHHYAHAQWPPYQRSTTHHRKSSTVSNSQPNHLNTWQPANHAQQNAPLHSSGSGHQYYQPVTHHDNSRQHSGRTRSSTAALLDGNGDLLPPAPLTPDDLEEEFDGECYFARHPNEIDSNLSLGTIVWHPPLATKRALPSTFDEAEQEAQSQSRAYVAEHDSVSIYLGASGCEEAFLSVRQTDDWHQVKDDPIYREFPLICHEILSLSEVYDRYSNRPDPLWASALWDRAQTATPDFSTTSSPPRCRTQPRPTPSRYDSGTYMQIDDIEDDRSSVAKLSASQPMSDHRPPSSSSSCSRPHSRASSTVSNFSQHKITRPIPLPPIHDQQQENILAALGVTGSARLVYQTPGPAFGAPPSSSSTHTSFKATAPIFVQHSTLPGLSIAVPPRASDTTDALLSVDEDATPRANRKRALEDETNNLDGGARVHAIPESDTFHDANHETPRPQRRKLARTD